MNAQNEIYKYIPVLKTGCVQLCDNSLVTPMHALSHDSLQPRQQTLQLIAQCYIDCLF